MTHVCVDAETFVETPWPDWLRKELTDRRPANPRWQ
jgi:acyl-CoA thioesterase FadM